MTAGDYETALKELETQRDNPAAQNYIGVCFMMKGDYDQAETFLSKAEKNGDPIRTDQPRTYPPSQTDRILRFIPTGNTDLGIDNEKHDTTASSFLRSATNRRAVFLLVCLPTSAYTLSCASPVLNSLSANSSARPVICLSRNNSSRSIPIWRMIH